LRVSLPKGLLLILAVSDQVSPLSMWGYAIDDSSRPKHKSYFLLAC
jgi:hypothetical protein